MGLIKAGVGALGGTMADQWKEYFYCDSLDAEVLAAKGQKRTGRRSSNKKGEDNIISAGSVIAVADGQCMMIVEQGKVVEVCAEPGEFVYEASTEPSIFCGSLGEGIKNTFRTIGKRFTFGGDTGKDQRVYYFNTKEITGNRFGTANPVPFKVVVNEALGFRLSVDIRCNGEYSYKIKNPLLFYTNVCGNVESVYQRSEIESMMKSELLSALQPALAKIAAQGIQYYEIPAHTVEITNALNEVLSDSWQEKRGMEVFSMNINSLSIPEDQRKKITEWEENSMTLDPNIAAARMVGAQTQAMQEAAKNQGGMGAMGGFFGMNMAQQAGGMNAAGLYSISDKQNSSKPSLADEWECKCGATSKGKFCPQCGSPRPAVGWTCKCGAVNKGRFCSECGSPKPNGVPQYKCDKCGWEPDDPTNPPRFCPECGDPFDSGDIK